MNALSAPGKVFLAGEYAVLDGGPALVAGVDLRLHASWEGGPGIRLLHRPSGMAWDGGPAPEELRFAVRGVTLALKLCAGEGLPERGFRLVFEDDFAAGGAKLGLGGSAAATVLAVRATCAAQGRALPDGEALSLAAAAHFVEQGGSGSGADVAACALGGVLQVRSHWKSPEEAMATPLQSPVEVRRIAAPADLRLLLAYSGKPANTRALVREVRRFAQGEPARWAAARSAIAGASESLAAALEAGARDSALEAVRAGAAAMARLGEQAGVPIVTAELAQACALAASAGAAGKPSGAGGGDCAVVLAFGDEAQARAEAALQRHFLVLRVTPA
jgi:phosphomevalonate kinase